MQLSLLCFELAFAVPVMCIAQLKFNHRSAATNSFTRITPYQQKAVATLVTVVFVQL